MERLTTESWDPDYDDKPVNQFGEKWQSLIGTYLNSTIDYIIKDLQIDPFEDGPQVERLYLGSLHLCEDGHLIATIYGGANGGGFRGEESNWKYYLSLVRKFLGKLLDFDFGHFCRDVWMIDWDNDCCDDVWTLRLGIELTDEQKLKLVECGKTFSILNPEKLHIGLDAATDLFTPMPVAQNVQASISQANESTRIDEMNNYDMIATLVRIDNNGEKEIDMRQVSSYWDALQLLADYAMDHAEDDEYVAEKYAMFMSDEDRYGAEKTVGWLEKNGKISETFVKGKYSIELRVYESDTDI